MFVCSSRQINLYMFKLHNLHNAYLLIVSILPVSLFSFDNGTIVRSGIHLQKLQTSKYSTSAIMPSPLPGVK